MSDRVIDPAPARRRPALLAGGLVLLLLLAAAAWSLLGGGAGRTPPAARTTPVMAATAVTKPMPVEIRTFGRVQAIASVAVRSRIDGVIASVPVEEGQDVKEGDVLVTLDDRQARAELKQAEGALTRDRAQLAKARRDLERLAPLEQKSFVSRQQLDQAQSAVAGLEGAVAANEAAVENARVRLSYTVMRAPIAGRIGSIAWKTGNAIRAADPMALLTINQIKPIYVSLSVPQGEFLALQEALAAGPVPVTASLPGETGAVERGEISFLENAVNPKTNTIGVKAAFPNESARLWPGQFVEVLVTLRVEQQAVVVPSTAVQAGPEGSFVFVIGADNAVSMQRVAVSRTIGPESVIGTGLTAGQRVVTSGQLALEPGAKVRVQDTAAEKPGSGNAS